MALTERQERQRARAGIAMGLEGFSGLVAFFSSIALPLSGHIDPPYLFPAIIASAFTGLYFINRAIQNGVKMDDVKDGIYTKPKGLGQRLRRP